MGRLCPAFLLIAAQATQRRELQSANPNPGCRQAKWYGCIEWLSGNRVPRLKLLAFVAAAIFTLTPNI